jgi:hypothetical protein
MVQEIISEITDAIDSATVAKSVRSGARIEVGTPGKVNMLTLTIEVGYEAVEVQAWDGDTEDMKEQRVKIFDLEVPRPEVGGVGDVDAVMTIVTMVAAALSELVVQ